MSTKEPHARTAAEAERGQSPDGTPRRTFLKGAGLLAAGALAPVASHTSKADDLGSLAAITRRGDDPYGTLHAAELQRETYQARLTAAQEEFERGIPPHANNGDESLYANRIAISTKGLRHDANGIVEADSYHSLLKALRTRSPADFENILLGGTTKLADPIGPLDTPLEGGADAQLAIPLAAPLASADLAADHIETYWLALLRDVPFTDYRDDTSNPLVLAAVQELNSLTAYKGPGSGGALTPSRLFRNTALYLDPSDPSGKRGRYVVPSGALDGPFVSQFLLRPIPDWGTIAGQPQLRPIQAAGESFATTFNEWLTLRNGSVTGRNITLTGGRRLIINGRDLATLARNAGPTVLHALQILLAAPNASDPTKGGIGAPVNPGNPYKSYTKISSGAVFSGSFFQYLVALAISAGTKASYYQNWYVNRRLRPEDYGGLVHQIKATGADYPIHPSILNSDALARTYAAQGTYLLSQASNVGAPLHPGYPSGATIQAAGPVTLLKAFFDDTYVIPNPVQVDPSDPTRLIPYEGPPLTLGGELDKLAHNIGFGRNWNGFHVRSDVSASVVLGESVAISLLRDQRPTYKEDFSGFTFRRLDGKTLTV